MAACYDIITAAENWVTVVARIGHVESAQPSRRARRGCVFAHRAVRTPAILRAAGWQAERFH